MGCLGYHGFVINDFVPKFSQYKWLDMSARHGDGNLDPTTGFLYEPAPYVDRVCEFQEAKPGRQVAIVTNKWGRYSYTVDCKQTHCFILASIAIHFQ